MWFTETGFSRHLHSCPKLSPSIPHVTRSHKPPAIFCSLAVSILLVVYYKILQMKFVILWLHHTKWIHTTCILLLYYTGLSYGSSTTLAPWDYLPCWKFCTVGRNFRRNNTEACKSLLHKILTFLLFMVCNSAVFMPLTCKADILSWFFIYECRLSCEIIHWEYFNVHST